MLSVVATAAAQYLFGSLPWENIVYAAPTDVIFFSFCYTILLSWVRCSHLTVDTLSLQEFLTFFGCIFHHTITIIFLALPHSVYTHMRMFSQILWICLEHHFSVWWNIPYSIWSHHQWKSQNTFLRIWIQSAWGHRHPYKQAATCIWNKFLCMALEASCPPHTFHSDLENVIFFCSKINSIY